MTAPFPTRPFLGLSFAMATRGEVLAWVREAAASDRFTYVVTPNVDHVVRLHEADLSSTVDAAYRGATLTLCDSRILAALARLSGVDLPVVPGSDLTAAILAAPAFAGLHCHVVGGSSATIETLRARFPTLEWTQMIPPFGVMHNPAAQQEIVQSIRGSRADIVFMAFGALQSELVCGLVAKDGRSRGIALNIGASLEFVTGEKRRAPALFQRLKLEWLFRLLSEPRRLWRRYLVAGPRVFAIWARYRGTA